MNPISLIDDQPLGMGGKTRDGLGFSVYSEVLSNALKNTLGPFSIGVFGEWGTGKTTLMKLTMDHLSKDENVLPVWFNAWEYEKEEHPIIPLISVLIRTLNENKTFLQSLNDHGKRLINILKAIAYGFAINVKGGLPGLGEIESSFAPKDMIDRLESLTSDPLLDKSLYYSVFTKLNEVGLTASKKIVIFIDDLDRCMPDQALKLLESMKLVLGQKGFLFVIGVARKVIEGAIIHKYVVNFGLERTDGKDYLDKIIQLPFHIPPHFGRMSEYVGVILEKVDTPFRLKLEKILPLIAESLGANPRSVVRFVNNLLVDISVASNLYANSQMDEVEIEYFAITRYLQMRSPEVFNALILSDELCHQLLDWDWVKLLMNSKSDNPEISRLSRFLMEDRRLFLLLNETKEGRNWLKEKDTRLGAIHFLKRNRDGGVNFGRTLQKGLDIILVQEDADTKISDQIVDLFLRSGLIAANDRASRLSSSRAVAVIIGEREPISEEFKMRIGQLESLYESDRSILVVPIIRPGGILKNVPDFLRNFNYLHIQKESELAIFGTLIEHLRMLSKV